jgi:AraC-like DNA-binding protein
LKYYNKRVQQLKKELYEKEYLIRHIIQAKNFADANYADKIDLNKMAREAHLSKFHFMRLFKASYGRTPYQYLVEVRMKKAKELLKKGLPVSAVCVSVGFDSIPSFTRVFKKITGTTPARFQLLAKKATLDKTC